MSWLCRLGRNFREINRRIGLRSVSSIAEVQKNVEAESVEGRYAAALFRVCRKAGATEKVLEELEALKHAVDSVTDLRTFVTTIGIPANQKAGVINELARKWDLDTKTTNFLNLLVENRRLRSLGKIIDLYVTLCMAQRGEMRCSVTSAKQLTDAEKKRIQQALQARAVDAKLVLSFEVSSNIMGGLVVRLGDQTLDCSVASRIERIHAQLAGPLSG